MEDVYVKLQADGKVFVIENDGAVTREKEIDPDSLISLVERSTYSQITDSYGGVLPKHCIYYGFAERRSGEMFQVVMLERKGCVRPYNHFGSIENVGYPKLIFAYKIANNKMVSSAVVAAIDEFIGELSPVYYFPYANVSHNGRICTGSYHYPEIDTLTGLNYLPEDFYLIEHTHEKNAVSEVIRDILDQVKEKPFDNSLLKFNTTFKQFVEEFCKG